MNGSFRRGTARPPAAFYIKGSYVLDYVFDRQTARDIDVFHERLGEPPTDDVVRAWLKEKGLPDAKVVEFTPVDDIGSCSGGGQPFFGFERWHLKQDGLLYTLEETDEPSGKLPLWGESAFVLRAVAMSREEARRKPLLQLQDIGDISLDEVGLKYSGKLLEKMVNHPELHLDDLAKELQEQTQRIERALAGDEEERKEEEEDA